MEQTLKVGDRVRLLGRPGVPTGTIMDASIPLGIKRDDGVKAQYHGEWWFEFPGRVERDRDFQAGDWVRYEGAPGYSKTDEFEGRIGQITALDELAPFTAKVDTLKDHVLLANLVKVAPPPVLKEGVLHESSGVHSVCEADLCGETHVEPAPVLSVTIEHDQWGRVEGIAYIDGQWVKDGRRYLLCDGWREVKPKRWATYARQELKDNEVWRFLSVWFEGEMDTRRFDLPDGYRWKKVEIEREVEG